MNAVFIGIMLAVVNHAMSARARKFSDITRRCIFEGVRCCLTCLSIFYYVMVFKKDVHSFILGFFVTYFLLLIFDFVQITKENYGR